MKRMKRSLALILSLALALNSSLLVLAEDVSADAGQAAEVAEKVIEETAPVEGQAEPAVEEETPPDEEIPPAEETSAAEEVEAQTVDEETEITLDGLLNTHPGTFLFTAPEDGEYRFRILSTDTDVVDCDVSIEGADGTLVDYHSTGCSSEIDKSYKTVYAALTGGTQYKIIFSGHEDLTVDLKAEKLKAVKSLEIVQLPSNASFVVDTYDEYRLLTGLIVKAVYEDDSEEEIEGNRSALDDRSLSDYVDSTNVDQGNPGTYPVYISFGGEQITLTVTISNDDSEIVVDVDEAHFPDEEFRDYVASYVDVNGDNKLSEHEISLREQCNANGWDISSLKGIEYLTSVNHLECGNNNLTELDLSSNTELTFIICGDNQLTSIDLGGLTKLDYLECSNNCLTELDLSSSPDIWTLENEFQTVDGTTYNGWNEDGVYDADHELLSDAYECAGKRIRLVQQKLSGIQFDPNEITISKGDSQDVSIQPLNPYVTEQFGATSWSIEPEGTDVFSIDEDVDGGNDHARIKGDNLGTATLKAAVGEHTAECTITVQDASIGAVPVDEEHFPNAAFRQYIEDQLDKNQNNSLSRTELANVTEINVRGQGVSDLTGIEYFTNLKHLECGENGLTSLDVSALTKLEYLEASNNQLSELDFTNNLNLTEIYLDYQKSGEKLYSGWNEEGVFDREHWLLWEGDFPGKVIKLVTQDATGVYVTRSVIMQPGEEHTFNANLTGSFFTETPHDYSWSTESGTSEIISLEESDYNDNEACITANKVGTEIVTVRASSYSTTFKVTVMEGTPVEITDENFPDESFRSYVENECDSDGDGFLSFEEQQDQTYMYLDWRGITNLKGIEYFTNLTYLNCQNNKLTTLDVTMLDNLRSLTCSNNKLTSLDLTGLGALDYVDVQYNKLEEIALSGCESLRTFYSSFNRFTKLDFSDCNKLENVWVGSQGSISSFASSDWYYDQEFTQNVGNGTGNYVAEDLRGRIIYLKEKEIRQIFMHPEKLTLGLPDTGEYYTALTSVPPDIITGGIRISVGCPEEAEIVLADPSLADIKAKDGCDKTEGYFTVIPKKTGTTTVTVTYKGISATSSLTIQKESAAIEISAKNFPDPVFRAAVANGIDRDKDGILSATELSNNTSIWSGTGACRSLKGIELLPYLQSVSITSPFLKEADLSKNPELTYIRIASPALNQLNVEGLTKVTSMYISGARRLGDVDVSKLKDLRVMELSGAGITSVDVTKNTKLKGLILTDTSVQSVDLTKNPELSDISFEGGEIKQLDLSQNKKLGSLTLANLPMETLDLANNPDIYQLDILNLPLTTFDLSPLKGLDFLYLTGSQLESIDLRENKELLQIHLNNSVGGEMGWYLDQAYAKPWGGDLETAKNHVLYRNPAYEAPIYDSPTYDSPTYGSPSEGSGAVNGLILDEGFVYGRLSTGILEEIATNRRILTILKNLGVTGVSCSLLHASGVYRANNISDTSAATFKFMGDAIDEGDQLIVLRRSDMDAAKNGENKWELIPADGVKVSEDAVTVTADQIGLPFAVLKVTSESKSLEDAEHTAVSGITDQIYDGTEKKQSGLTVTYDGAELREDTDYTVTYKNHKNIGAATVTITGKGDYEGTVTKSFQINMPKTAGLATSAEKTTGMTLKWTKDTGVTGYEVQYSTSATFASGVTKKITSNTSSLAVTGLSAGKSYYYRVRAYATISKKTTYGSYSETYKAVTATAAPEKPVVKGVTDEQSVNVSWKKVSGASKYVVYRSTKATSGYKNIATLSGATATYKDTGLDAGKTYFYKIRTYRAGTGHNVYSEYSVYNACATATATPVISKVTGGSGKMTVSWGRVSGATRYEVYWGTSKTNMTKAAALGSSTTSYTKTGLSAGKTYYMKIYTCRTVNKADVYNQSCAIRYGATSPAAPAISSVSGGVETASVTWKAVSGASGYAVYMSTSATTGYKLVESITGRTNVSYEATGLAVADKYYFKIRSYRNGDNAKVYSGYSAVQSCETATATPVISSVTSASKAVTVKWSNVDKESGYELYMASSETGNYSKIASLKANVTSYKKTGLATGRKYYFKVYTYRTVGGKKIVNDICAVKGGATRTATPSIASLTAAVTQTTVKWKAVSGASGYQVYMATSSGGTYSKKASVSGGTKTSAVIKNLTPGKKYYFKIRSYISGSKLTTATGSFSAVKSCTTQAWPAIKTPQMKAYEGADYQFDENGTLTISWAALSGVTGYEVEKKKGEGIYQLVEEVTEADPDGSYTYHEAEFAQDDIYTLRVRAYKIVSGERVYAQDEEAQYGREIQILLAS